MAEKVYEEIELSSGFTIHVSSLPPYYLDMINDIHPIPDYPSRKLELKAGDTIDWPYEPGEEVPEEGDEDYELFLKYHIIDKERKEIANTRNTARVNYLLNMCVEIIDGPIDFEDTESWGYKLTTAFPDFHLPDDKGQRMLVFIKHFVITTIPELNNVIDTCTAQEVTMEGITQALRGFRGVMEEGGFREGDNEEEGG